MQNGKKLNMKIIDKRFKLGCIFKLLSHTTVFITNKIKINLFSIKNKH